MNEFQSTMLHIHTKRPHHKTRSGCRSCKRRRVKCDELRPKCTSCTLRKLDCEYTFIKSSGSAAGTPRRPSYPLAAEDALKNDQDTAVTSVTPYSPPSMGYSPHATSTELRLLHHYTTVTTETLNLSEESRLNDVWTKEIPQLAFEHDYLLNNVLAIASMHICQLRPQSADYSTAGRLMNKALRRFRNAILTVSPNNFVPILANAALMSPVSMVANRVSGQPLAILNWVRMHRGAVILLGMVPRDIVMESPIAPIFRIAAQKKTPDPIRLPSVLLPLLDLIDPDEQNMAYRDVIRKGLLGVGRLYAGLALHNGELDNNVQVLRWPFDIPEEFTTYARSQRPHALVLLAHYVLFFEFLGFWWAAGIAKNEIYTISNMLSDEWQPFIKVPQLAVQLDNREKMVELLLEDLIDSLPLESILTIESQAKFVRNESNLHTSVDSYQPQASGVRWAHYD